MFDVYFGRNVFLLFLFGSQKCFWTAGCIQKSFAKSEALCRCLEKGLLSRPYLPEIIFFIITIVRIDVNPYIWWRVCKGFTKRKKNSLIIVLVYPQINKYNSSFLTFSLSKQHKNLYFIGICKSSWQICLPFIKRP